MLRYLIRRLMRGGAALLVLVVVVFGIVRLLGDPTTTLLPPEASREEAAELLRLYGLDQPLLIQLLRFVTGLLHGDFGRALYWRTSVGELIADRLPKSILLACVALALSIGVGIPLGVVAAARRGTFVDFAARALSITGASLPGFWIGILLINLFALQLRLFPTGGSEQPGSLVLPAVTLALGVTASFVRLVRSSMLEVLETDYVKLAKAKGVPRSMVIWKHALRNALLPTITYSSVIFAALLGGAVVTETVFSWPGLARLLVEAVRARDLPVLQATIIVLGAGFILAGVLADMIYLLLNPAVRGAAR
jgi:peptide/nickel transport system permease protein